jgi:hypothetical protein
MRGVSNMMRLVQRLKLTKSQFFKWVGSLVLVVLALIFSIGYISYVVSVFFIVVYSDKSNGFFIGIEKWLIIQMVIKNNWLVFVAMIMFFLLSGIVFFLIRKFCKFCYGAGEIIVGTLTCIIGVIGPIKNVGDPDIVSTLISKDQSATSFLTILSGTYIIVRGIINIAEGHNAKRSKK